MTTSNPIPVPGGTVASHVIAYPAPGPAGPVGPPGERGPAGPASALPAVFSGPMDPPDYVEGAKPGDSWINTATGATFTLN